MSLPLGTSIAIVFTLSAACVADPPPEVGGAEQAVQTIVVDPRRSLAVTEIEILEGFTFDRVLDQLVAQSEVPGLTSLALFQQWWDTQNPPTCTGTLNDFPYQCRPAPAEGAQATVDPFVDPGVNPNEYIPIGLFNRFDLAPSDGSNCGEHRIVFARRAGISESRDRNLIIVEATMPNPHPQQGLDGCKKVADFWADLTDEDDPLERAADLEDFYFVGVNGMPPVVHIDHLGAGPDGVGQFRTNQFMQVGISPGVWSLREFKLVRTCADDVCTAMTVVPVTVKNNPFGGLFDPASTHPQAAAFQAALVGQVEALAAPVLADIDVSFDDAFNSGQSQASGTTENNFVVQFGLQASPLRTAIEAELAAIGSTLTADDIVKRAQGLSCAGCHRLNAGLALGSGLISPSALGFVHVSEREPETTIDGVVRYQISPALTDAFLPKRQQVLEDFLNLKLKKPPKPKDPIGGKRVH
jgi:hypothetical protein